MPGISKGVSVVSDVTSWYPKGRAFSEPGSRKSVKEVVSINKF
jgi:hypothetical protein